MYMYIASGSDRVNQGDGDRSEPMTGRPVRHGQRIYSRWWREHSAAAVFRERPYQHVHNISHSPDLSTTSSIYDLLHWRHL